MGSTISYENNASIPLFLALGLQILLILLNRGYLQLIIGVCIALEGMILPVYVSIAYDVLASIGDAYYEGMLLPLGWVVTVLAWILLACSIWLAVVFQKFKKATCVAQPLENK